jgi:DNA repair protein SbcD/Mre11
MKLVVISDLHLDASFASHGLTPDVGRKLRAFMHQTVLNVVKLVKSTGADALLIAGDLFEQERVSPKTATLLRYAFSQLDPVPVYISPGNEDWYGPDSLYQQEWSPNVHIFTSTQLSPIKIAENITLWGAAHCAPSGAPNFLRGFRADRSGVHIGLFHGSEMSSFGDQGGSKFPHAPFEMKDLENSGLHHVFLGHYHQSVEAVLYTYPGTPHPLAYSERGARGVVVADVSTSGTVHRHWKQIGGFPFQELAVDITGCVNSDNVRDRLRSNLSNLQGVARVTLFGEAAPTLEFNLKELTEAGYAVDLSLRTGKIAPTFDLATLAKEPTVRGQFVRDVLDEQMEPEKRNRILVMGLRALEGKEDLEAIS